MKISRPAFPIKGERGKVEEGAHLSLFWLSFSLAHISPIRSMANTSYGVLYVSKFVRFARYKLKDLLIDVALMVGLVEKIFLITI
jgi:hypothetical protein